MTLDVADSQIVSCELLEVYGTYGRYSEAL